MLSLPRRDFSSSEVDAVSSGDELATPDATTTATRIAAVTAAVASGGVTAKGGESVFGGEGGGGGRRRVESRCAAIVDEVVCGHEATGRKRTHWLETE